MIMIPIHTIQFDRDYESEAAFFGQQRHPQFPRVWVTLPPFEIYVGNSYASNDESGTVYWVTTPHNGACPPPVGSIVSDPTGHRDGADLTVIGYTARYFDYDYWLRPVVRTPDDRVFAVRAMDVIVDSSGPRGRPPQLGRVVAALPLP